MSQPVRTRFAPSPTGYLHLGGLRSALFNYLFARHHGGSFILRIEDTDRERLVGDATLHVVDSLKWLGIAPDEGPGAQNDSYGPYVQSERLKLYSEYAEQLLNNSLVYRDWTTPEQLTSWRQEAQANKKPFRFTKALAKLKPDNPNDPYVLRFEVPTGNRVIWQDAVRGEQSWQREVLDDFVAIKSDGYPTYHFANVVDDHLMQISHVLRADEWLSSTPKHLLLYEALGWQAPIYAHLPAILGPDRKSKLSKRHGVKSALEYRDEGYLPEAVFNFLVSLGFNDGTTQEVYSADELIKAFSLERVQTSPAGFDAERLTWMNGLYIRNLSLPELALRTEKFWPPEAKQVDRAQKLRVLGLVKERLKYLAELPELTRFFFATPQVDPVLLTKQLDSSTACSLLKQVIEVLSQSDFTEPELERRLRELVEHNQVKSGPLFGLIRVSITGQTAAPGLFETLAALGKITSLERLKAAAHQLE